MSVATDQFYAELRTYLRCAVCGGKVVDSVERRWDLVACTETAIAKCHGQLDVVTVPSAVVEALATTGSLSMGLAFDKKTLPAAVPSQFDACPIPCSRPDWPGA